MFGYKSYDIDFLVGNQWLVWLALIALIGFSFWMYRQTNPPVRPWVKIILGGLRLLAVAALIGVLLEPVISYSREFNRKPRLAVLTDQSASMERVEQGKSRSDRIDSLFSSTGFSELNDQIDIEWYQFAGELTTEFNQTKTDRTALGTAFEELNRLLLPAPADYWLVATDGNSNWGPEPISVLDGLSQPVLTLDAALVPAQFDVGIESIEYNKVLFAGQRTEVKVKLGWRHALDKSVTVQLSSRAGQLDDQKLSVDQESGFGTVTLAFTPSEPGRQMLSLKLRSDGDTDDVNNSRTIAVKVLKSKLAVLVVSQKPDYELSFLKRFLERSSKYDVDLRVLNPSSGNLAGVFPSRQAELNRFDLVILHDVNPGLIDKSSDLIRSYLQDKGGAMWVQIGQSMAENKTPEWLGELMPFYNSEAVGTEFREFHGEPDEDQLFHPLVRLADSRSGIRQAWSDVPPFKMLVPCDKIDPSATILVTVSGRRGLDDRKPVIGFKRTGPGKLVASSASPFWQWEFRTGGYGSDNKKYAMFLEGLISWLTIPEDYDPVRITPVKEIFTRGEDISFEGIAYDQGYRAIQGVSGSVEIANDSSGQKFESDLIEIKEGTYSAELKGIPSGTYRFIGRLEKEGRLLKESKGMFRVEKFSVEEYDQSGKPELLKQIAGKTGGTYARIDQSNQLLSMIDHAEIKETQTGEASLWNNYWLLVVFVSSLAIEWVVRKLNHLL